MRTKMFASIGTHQPALDNKVVESAEVAPNLPARNQLATMRRPWAKRAPTNNGNHRQAAHAWNNEAIDPIHAIPLRGQPLSHYSWYRLAA
jgi:hypothetical protein